jgi:hypothetical protein
MNKMLSFFKSRAFARICMLLLLQIWAVNMYSQNENKPSLGIELKTNYSFLMPHHDHMRILTEQHFAVFQLNLFKSGNHGKEWHKEYAFPQVGVSLLFSPLSSPKYIGYGAAVVPFINFPLFKVNKSKVCFLVGSGPGFIQKPFHVVENYKNEAIGSTLNAALLSQLDYRYFLTERTEISAGVSILHFSNGKTKTPNLGLNNVGIYAGIAHHFQSKKSVEASSQNQDYWTEGSWEKSVFFGAALKQIYPVGGKYYLYSAYSLNIKNKISKKSKIGLGLEVYYDYSDRAHFRLKGFDKPDIAYAKPGIYALHDFTIGKMSIFIHLGTYLYAFDKNQNVGMIYDRLGVQYYFNKNLSAHIALKTHYAKADCIEWALNLSF